MTDPKNQTVRFPTARNMKLDNLINQYRGIREKADGILKQHNIGGDRDVPQVPSEIASYITTTTHGDPIPPVDITEVPDFTLGKIISYFRAHTNHVGDMTSKAKSRRDIQAVILKKVKAEVSLTLRENGTPAGEIKDRIERDDQHNEVERAYLILNAVYQDFDQRYTELRGSMAHLSREQTRRADELEGIKHEESGGRERPYARGTGGEDSPFASRFKR